MTLELTVPRPPTQDVILRDGSTLRLRPAGEDDAGALVEFFLRLSPESRYLRFQGATAVDLGVVRLFVRGDWPNTLSLVAERIPTEVVAVATLARLRDPKRAEVAFAVADDLQGRGIGTRLLERLAAHGAEAGVEQFVAQVLPQNVAMLKVFSDAGFATHRQLEGGVVEVRLDLSPTVEVRERADERDHVGVVASLEPFFKPRSLAVVGASARRGTIGGELFRNVLASDFDGAAYPVNGKGQPVGGVPGYSSIAEIPAAIDLAVICLPGPAVVDAAKAALDKGVK